MSFINKIGIFCLHMCAGMVSITFCEEDNDRDRQSIIFHDDFDNREIDDVVASRDREAIKLMFRQNFSALGFNSGDEAAARVDMMLKHDVDTFFKRVLRHDNKTIGFLCCEQHSIATRPKGQVFHILYFIIDEGYQGQGHGQYFLQQEINNMREKGAGAISLNVAAVNIKAQNLYVNKCGFKESRVSRLSTFEHKQLYRKL